MPIITRVDKYVDWLEWLADNKKVEKAIVIFLGFAVGFFGKVIFDVINR